MIRSLKFWGHFVTIREFQFRMNLQNLLGILGYVGKSNICVIEVVYDLRQGRSSVDFDIEHLFYF